MLGIGDNLSAAVRAAISLAPADRAAFVGTQISNLDAATVELMATQRHPPTVFDVLNDVHRACLSDEMVWFAGIHAHTRALARDRLANAAGRITRGHC